MRIWARTIVGEAVEGQTAGQQLVEDHPQAVNVRRGADRLHVPIGLLG